ncbi:MAG: stage III sporulation protein AE [Clostridia bacterium]|nr:stage III sporulation protein AE [Clostridia bacterium]
MSDNIEEQLGNLDLSEMEDFTNDLNSDNSISFTNMVYQIINGEYNSDYSSVKEYLIGLFLNDVNDYLPILFTIVAISVFCALIQNAKSIFASESVSNIIFLVCFLTVILLLSSHVISIWQETKKTLENISKTNEIMSPIILTLMIASGGNVSAAIYKPAVAFFSNGVINVLLYVCLPIISLITIFGVISNFSSNFKLKKFGDFFNGLIKWIVGIIVSIFGIYISIQGVSGAIHDGISIKAAKYAISNSIPLVGGFLRDGFDLVVAGSVLIKNSVGVASIVVLFFYILSPVIKIAVFGLMLKLVAAVTESISDSKISDLCSCVAKSISYLNVLILLSGFMMFISILLMIFSANAFF